MLSMRDASGLPERDEQQAPSGPDCVPATGVDGRDQRWWGTGWAIGLVGVLAVFLSPGVVRLIATPPPGAVLALLLAATLALAAIFLRVVRRRTSAPSSVPWLELAVLVLITAGLGVQAAHWAPTLALSAFALALWLPAVPSAVAVICLSGLSGLFNWLGSGQAAAVLTAAFGAAIMGGFGYLTNRSLAMSARLRTTEQELARMAAAEERLRIARELHDLLGHSLSLIAMKAELAQTQLPGDATHPRAELRDIETVARRAVDDVRDTITGYRRPDLAAELALARRTAASAGIDIRTELPREWSLPAEVDSVLAWSVREATTNVIRHSKARSCTIRLVLDGGTAAVEVADDGIGAQPESGRQPGSGLTGLAERTTHLGGEVRTGSTDTGFWLRVCLPTTPAGNGSGS